MGTQRRNPTSLGSGGFGHKNQQTTKAMAQKNLVLGTLQCEWLGVDPKKLFVKGTCLQRRMFSSLTTQEQST